MYFMHSQHRSLLAGRAKQATGMVDPHSQVHQQTTCSRGQIAGTSLLLHYWSDDDVDDENKNFEFNHPDEKKVTSFLRAHFCAL
jgi:hypothetical protein